MKKTMFKSDLTTRESDNDKKYLEGYFIRFNEKTELQEGMFETIAPTAVERSLEKDIVCLFNHDSAKVLGRVSNGTLKLKSDDKGLFGVVEVNQNDQEALDIYARVARGDINACSFGFYPISEDIRKLEDGSVEFIVKDADILEVSIVTFPAYPTTQIEARELQLKNFEMNSLERRKQLILNEMKGA